MQIFVNGQLLEIPQPFTVAELLAHVNVRQPGVAVEVNQSLIPRPQHAKHYLSAGDRVEIVTLVGGG